MTASLDELMERASQALVRMDYLTCEALCLEALALAREQAAWAYYARILLPLQEARRQRRMIAADGTIRLGTASLDGPVEPWLDAMPAGCLLVTGPHTPAEARTLDQLARQQRRHVEVLYADAVGPGERWTVQSFRGPDVGCPVPAPPAAWQDTWLAPGERPTPTAGQDAGHVADHDTGQPAPDPAATPADWFLDAAEALGDAALEQVDASLPPQDRLARLEQMLDVVSDHEILHQRLGDAARAMR